MSNDLLEAMNIAEEARVNGLADLFTAWCIGDTTTRELLTALGPKLSPTTYTMVRDIVVEMDKEGAI